MDFMWLSRVLQVSLHAAGTYHTHESSHEWLLNLEASEDIVAKNMVLMPMFWEKLDRLSLPHTWMTPREQSGDMLRFYIRILGH